MEHADTLRAIAAMLDGTEWNTGMLEEIAEGELHDGND